ncbi:LLM class flavin-dependent oxidoreductase [Tsukamurella sp. 8F]|uniref:LLM class flavin-dependent oxidoreductase n=1 Tax=unclassified Tsukamurella TaxID=2633480 RepID=UPI0023B89A19|nr:MULTISPECIES: LLM class flavin-dependent oxidoreductase [unclassified Tsukamurella]MDF0528873.1 LLM class flavin-dependent oxidoreductase [Tsukamurella sp. 8J]MDF0586708.1 LLM class flavin-dependent oxidoreductase [Tsukamurella sp. 8F]
MHIAIALPSHVDGFDVADIPDWARTVEQLGFDALSFTDRPSWTTSEPLTSLAAAAAVTRRIGLLTSVLLAPLYVNAGLFATATATIDRLAGQGRLRLGLAPGGRPQDYTGAPVDFADRGPAFDSWLERVRETWAGTNQLGPRPATPGGPPLLFGGSSTPTVRRVATHGSGWIGGGMTPEQVADFITRLNASFADAGRVGRPHVAVSVMTSIGPDAPGTGVDAVAGYYEDLGAEFRDSAVAGTLTTVTALRTIADAYSRVGVDELILTPNHPEPDTLGHLRDALA